MPRKFQVQRPGTAEYPRGEKPTKIKAGGKDGRYEFERQGNSAADGVPHRQRLDTERDPRFG